MASRNLEQGIVAVQQNDLVTGKRLLKIALKNDNLNQQERVQALIWLAETDSNPQFKVEQYQQAITMDPTNQDIINRFAYWSQAVQQQNNAARDMPPESQNQRPDWQNPQQQQFNQQFTPSQPLPPINPNQRPDWQQNSQQPPPNQQNQQPGWQNSQQYTPSQPMPHVNPNQRPDWQQNSQQAPNQHNQQPGWQNSQQQQFNQQYTPSQGIPPVDPNQVAFNQGYTPPPTQQLPPHQTGTMPAVGGAYGQQVIHLQGVQRTVGIAGGPAGKGTGFFVTRDGLIVTTRHNVGGERHVTVQLLDHRNLMGEVVRAFPVYDLALVQVNVQLVHLMGVSKAPIIPDDTPILAVTHAGEGIQSRKRHSINNIGGHWFPTVINHLKDAGGNPIFDAGNMLVGMLTGNASRSNGYMYGLHIQQIYHCIDMYIHEKGQLEGQNTIYCNACGIISRAPSFGGHFCENCGNTHPYAVNIHRYPQPGLAHLYGEDTRGACPKCGSNVGFYERECLRCGYEL